MNAHALARAIDEALYVRHDERAQMVIVWKGGNTINAYDLATGKNVSCWSLSYDSAGQPPSLQAIKDSIARRMATGDYP